MPLGCSSRPSPRSGLHTGAALEGSVAPAALPAPMLGSQRRARLRCGGIRRAGGCARLGDVIVAAPSLLLLRAGSEPRPRCQHRRCLPVSDGGASSSRPLSVLIYCCSRTALASLGRLLPRLFHRAVRLPSHLKGSTPLLKWGLWRRLGFCIVERHLSDLPLPLSNYLNANTR